VSEVESVGDYLSDEEEKAVRIIPKIPLDKIDDSNEKAAHDSIISSSRVILSPMGIKEKESTPQVKKSSFIHQSFPIARALTKNYQ